MTHLEAAAKSLTAKPFVERGSGALERMSRSPAVVIYPADGQASRDGQKVARLPTPGQPYGLRYRLWAGRMEYAVRLRAKDDKQLTGMLTELLTYLSDHRLHDAAENHIAVPDGDVRLSWRDPEGLLMGDHTVELLIPAGAAIYRDRERKPIDIVVSYELANSLEGEDQSG